VTCTSLSNGRVVVLRNDAVQLDFDAHGSAEVWTAAISPHDDAVVFTGADDGHARLWDVRSGVKTGELRNAHGGAGVCAFEFLSNVHGLATGGYDGQLRVWDRRALAKPVATSPTMGNGGVWRIRRRDGVLAAACIRGGFALFDEATLQVCAQFPERNATAWEALAYGVDWLDAETLVGCSFYDKTVRLLRHSLTPAPQRHACS